MELGCGIVEFFKNKSILVTGATGFLAKVFVEKVLRVQPDIKRIYLLIRASDASSLAHRFNSEVVGKDLFSVLKEKHGKGFQSFISDKMTPVAGDISKDNLGIEDVNLATSMTAEINVVVNVAATTNFNERYDVALGINTLGAKHCLEFAKKCPNLDVFLHVSTAYVSGTREGRIMEKMFEMGQTLNGCSKLDIDGELRLAGETLKDLRQGMLTTEREIKSIMKYLGIQRAKRFGWPNTYVFTKAMGEMILGQMRGDVPLVILRPTMITSLVKDPLPGWMEGARTIDSLIVSYSKGKLECFLGDLDFVMDIIPGDMVSNAMIVSIVAQSNKPCETIYHVSSSLRNPVKYISLQQCNLHYFTVYPQCAKDGTIIKVGDVPVFNTMSSFRRYMNIRYKLPLEGLGLVSTALCGLFAKKYQEHSRTYNYIMHLAELYEPFAFFKGFFDDRNSEKLLMSLNNGDSKEAKMFAFDCKTLDWNRYLIDVHIPGVVKYATK